MLKIYLVLLFVLSGVVSCSGTHHATTYATTHAPGIAKKTHVLTVANTETAQLEKALNQALELLKNGHDVELRLASGTYYLNDTIRLTNNSLNKLSIVGSVQGETVISGAKTLPVKWQKHSEQVYKTKLNIGAVDQLFIAGEQQIRARFPNYQVNASIFNGFSADAISPERTSHWMDPKGAYVHTLHKGRWGSMHYKISGKAKDGSWELDGGYQINRPSPLHHKYRFVENVFAELDAPQEWFFDESTQTLYFYPENLAALSHATIEAPQLAHLIEIRGSKDHPTKNISVRNITLSHTTHTFMQTQEPLLRSDWAIYRGAAIFIEHAQGIEIIRNRLVDLGGNAISINRFANDILVDSNHISNIGAGAINVIGDPSAVRSPSFTYNDFVKLEDMDFALGPKNDLYPSNTLIQDNLIHDIGRVEKQVAGVQISMAKGITIRHNSIYRVPRAGINIGEGTWGGHVIEYNDVFDTVLETGDHGAFNSWGRDRFWHPNRTKMNEIYALHPTLHEQDAMETVVIRHNRFQSNFGWDIDLDDGASNYDIYNNVMLAGGLKLREGFNRRAHNNIMINNSVHPHVWFENSQDVITNNILLVEYKPVASYHWGARIDRNLFSTKAALENAQSLGLDTNSAFGDPQFIDPEHGDYRVEKGSKALQLGFRNFSMDNFGVVSERLRKIAETPVFPELFLANAATNTSKVYDILGAKVKSVETLGEQSALGIPEISGVMVVSVEAGSIMAKGGLKANDVIFIVYGKDKVTNVQDLLKAYQTGKWRKKIKLDISRNQSMQSLTINTHP